MNNLKEKIAVLVGLETVTKHAYIITIGMHSTKIQCSYSENVVAEVHNSGAKLIEIWSRGRTEYHEYSYDNIGVNVTLCKLR